MPTRKQRRRQAKAKRHEYEYVYVDEKGNEVEVAEERRRRPSATASRNGRAKPNPRATRAGARVQPPSWSRVAKRGLIFAPLMFIIVMLRAPTRRLLQQALTTRLAAGDLPAVQLLHGLAYVQALREAHRRAAAVE